jgi:hypothetical protein
MQTNQQFFLGVYNNSQQHLQFPCKSFQNKSDSDLQQYSITIATNSIN